MRSLVWFRGKDLRITDHAPLDDSINDGEAICVFVLDPFFFSASAAAALPHRMQFLLESLESLRRNIEQKGGELLLVPGKSHHVIPRLAQLWRVDRVVAHAWSEPFARLRDAKVRRALPVPFELYGGETLLPPETVRTKGGTPFSVYTPFARAARAHIGDLSELRAPRTLPAAPADIDRSVTVSSIPTLQSLGLNHNPQLLQGGEAAAHKRLKAFLGELEGYQDGRDILAEPATSRLSADLKFGTLSVRQVYRAVTAQPTSESRERYLSQLLWREFAYACLWDRPGLLHEPFREDFRAFPWNHSPELFNAWWQGTTGYPVVDASARQLLQEGYVHNRARMISASFLSKHLLVDYKLGEAHYLKYLTDGDWALNNMGWQWSAGCGVDAQPYFRVFNPISQGEKFDKEGRYIRRYLPELSQLPNKYIHRPWEAPPQILRQANVTLGKTYPLPIVDHQEARARFLDLAKSHLAAARAGV